MTYNDLAMALVNESSINELDNELNNFNKLCESVNVLNENGIMLESFNKEEFKKKFKEKVNKVIDKLSKALEWIKDKLSKLWENIKRIGRIITKQGGSLKNDIEVNNPDNVAEYANSLIELYNNFVKEKVSNLLDEDYDKRDKLIEEYTEKLNSLGDIPEMNKAKYRKGDDIGGLLDRILTQLNSFKKGASTLSDELNDLKKASDNIVNAESSEYFKSVNKSFSLQSNILSKALAAQNKVIDACRQDIETVANNVNSYNKI